MKLIHTDLILYLASLHALLLCAEDRLVQVPLRCREGPRYGERARDITGIHGLFASGINQDELQCQLCPARPCCRLTSSGSRTQSLLV